MKFGFPVSVLVVSKYLHVNILDNGTLPCSLSSKSVFDPPILLSVSAPIPVVYVVLVSTVLYTCTRIGVTNSFDTSRAGLAPQGYGSVQRLCATELQWSRLFLVFNFKVPDNFLDLSFVYIAADVLFCETMSGWKYLENKNPDNPVANKESETMCLVSMDEDNTRVKNESTTKSTVSSVRVATVVLVVVLFCGVLAWNIWLTTTKNVPGKR